MMQELEISRHTAVDWASFNREVIFTWIWEHRTRIGGMGVEVEIDESKFGKLKKHRGHHVEGQWVFGGVERGSNRCFLVPVVTHDKDSLLSVIQQWVLPGTTIISDCWKAYDCLELEGFQQFKVNYSVNFKYPDSGQHTNTIEGLRSHAKYSQPQYPKKRGFVAGYLAFFMFLKICRYQNLKPFNKFLEIAGSIHDPTKLIEIENESEPETENESEISDSD